MPVARDVPQGVAVKLLEQSEDFPAVLAQQDSVRAYPSPYGLNAAQLLGYLGPVTQDELSAAQRTGDSSINGASVVGRAGIEKAYDSYLRGQPGYTKVTVDSMGRVLGDSGTVASKPGDTLVTSIDASVQSDVEKQLHDAITTARATYDKVTHRNYIADSGAAVVMEARTGRIVAMASQPTYNPDIWSGGISEKQLKALYAPKNDDPLLSRHPGHVRPRLDLEAVHDDRGAQQRVHPEHAARLLLGGAGRQPAVQELRVLSPTATSPSPRRSRSPATPSSTAWG